MRLWQVTFSQGLDLLLDSEINARLFLWDDGFLDVVLSADLGVDLA